jgi:ribosomal protein L37AE/L43A
MPAASNEAIDGQVVEAEVIPMIERASQAIAARGGRPGARQQLGPIAPVTHAVTPQVHARDLVARLDLIQEVMKTSMRMGVDYGVVPGTDKPTLFKPGAEKLGVTFELDIQIVNHKTWGPGDHLTVESHATVYHAPSGSRLGFGEGLCTTREKKYAKRHAERSCPECGTNAVIKGKQEYGGGWLCFKRKGGCGAKFADNDQAITGQQVGVIDNPDLPDEWNTVVKMGAKRARVDAVLAVTGASAIFTQDAEDDPIVETHQAAAHRQPQPTAAAPPMPGESESRGEILACAQEVLRRGIWDERRLNAELVIAKATDTSSLEAAVASIPFEQLAGVQGRLINVLPAEPAS